MKLAYILASALLLAACAAEVYRVPTQFSASADSTEFILDRDVTVMPSSGDLVTLNAGSIWVRVGRVPQGSVYAIKNDVFSVRGRNHHEAQCVVTEVGKLVGFYLPGESAFAPVDDPVQLPFNRK